MGVIRLVRSIHWWAHYIDLPITFQNISPQLKHVMYLSGVIYLESLLQCWRGLVSIVLSQTSSLSLWVGYPLQLRACACGWEPWRSMAESTEWWSPRRRYLCDTVHQWLLLPLYRLLIFASILVVEFAHKKRLLTFVIKQYTLVIDSGGMLVGVWYCFA